MSLTATLTKTFDDGKDEVFFVEAYSNEEELNNTKVELLNNFIEEEQRDFKGAQEIFHSSEDLENPLIASDDQQATRPQGAIDPETGEINWDCPCLEKAIQPPCGEYFKAAFSCFVKSTTVPKGEDCFEKFVAMNECFFAHPEIYAPSEAEDREGVEASRHETPEATEDK